MHAGRVFQAFAFAHAYLRAQAVVPGVHRRANYGGESRIDRNLPAHNGEYALFPWISRARLANKIQFPPGARRLVHFLVLQHVQSFPVEPAGVSGQDCGVPTIPPRAIQVRESLTRGRFEKAGTIRRRLVDLLQKIRGGGLDSHRTSILPRAALSYGSGTTRKTRATSSVSGTFPGRAQSTVATWSSSGTRRPPCAPRPTVLC